MINNHELRRRIEEVKKDLKVLEKQVLELDYQIAPEVSGKAGEVKEFSGYMKEDKSLEFEDKEVTDVTNKCQEQTLAQKILKFWSSNEFDSRNEMACETFLLVEEHYAPLLQAEYRKGLKQGIERSCNYNEGRKQAIAEMKEKFEGRVNWLSDEYGSRKDFIINLSRNLFHPEEKE